jgi:hypothetical protein
MRLVTSPGGRGVALVEHGNFLRLALIQDGEVVLLQVANRRAFAVDDNVDFHQAGVDAQRRILRQAHRGRTQ